MRYEAKVNEGKVVVTDTVTGDNYYGRIENGKLRASNGFALTMLVKANRELNFTGK